MKDAVLQIKDRLSIVDVVSAYVELHKAGRHFKGKSPFTNEKTPSFYVSPDRGMYYCFSTSQGGDMFTFIETIEGVDFKGALKFLAEKANVELVPVSPQKRTERERLIAAMEEATKFYQDKLAETPKATAYLETRGLTAVTIEAWRIGFAPGPPEAGWAEVKEHLLKKGFTEPELFKAGLIKESGKGKAPYDVFRNRIMFPLFDQGGIVVGFSGRILEAGPDIPKYVNSPETELYKKSELLFGFNKAKKGIRQLDFSLIVEGQFDVVMSHQAGYANTVAVSGTALTAAHVQMLERLANKVVLALDADKAGLAAVHRAADLMLRRGLDVKVASIPAGNDPADIVLKDIREYKKIIGASMHVIEFMLKVLMDQKLDERTFKLRAREEIIPYILLLPNHIDQDYFEGKLAEALNTTKEAIHYEVERMHENKQRQVSSTETSLPVKPASPVQKKEAIKRHISLLTYLIGVLPLFEEDVAEKIKKELEVITEQSFSELEGIITAPAKAEVLFRTESFLDKNPRRVFVEEFIHSLNQLRSVMIKLRLKMARESLEEAERIGRTGDIEDFLALVSRLQTQLQLKPYTEELINKVEISN